MIKKRILFVMVTALLICTALCGCGAKKAARPAATAEPAATVKPVTTPKPTPTPTPTPSPTPTPEPTPEPTPDPAKQFINIDTSDLINITKNPGGEYVTPGSTAMFISTADGAESYEWRFVAPDYESEVIWNASDLQQRFPGLYTFNGETNTLTISGIPLELNGWYAVCLFTDSGGGMTASEGAKIEVAGASPVRTEAEREFFRVHYPAPTTVVSQSKIRDCHTPAFVVVACFTLQRYGLSCEVTNFWDILHGFVTNGLLKWRKTRIFAP